MGQNGLIGCPIARTHCRQEGTVEPSAVLIAAFQVKVGGPSQVRPLLKHGRMAHSGIKPHIENVGFFYEVFAAAFYAGEIRRQ